MKILEQIENETKKINSNIYNFSFSSDEMYYKSMLIGFNKNLFSFDNEQSNNNNNKSSGFNFINKNNGNNNNTNYNNDYEDNYFKRNLMNNGKLVSNDQLINPICNKNHCHHHNHKEINKFKLKDKYNNNNI